MKMITFILIFDPTENLCTHVCKGNYVNVQNLVLFKQKEIFKSSFSMPNEKLLHLDAHLWMFFPKGKKTTI